MEQLSMLDKIKWFWRYYRHYKYVLFVLILLTPIQRLMQVALPRLIEFAIDYMKTGQVSSNWAAKWLSNFGANYGISISATYAIALILLGFIGTIIYSFIQCHRAWMNFKLEWLFRQDAFSKALSKGPDFFNRFRVGDLVTRMTDDVADKLSWFACSGIFRFYEAVLMVIFTIAMMASINPLLTLWSVAPLPFLIIIFFKSATVLDTRYDHLQKRISKFNDIMEACFSGIRVVKAYVQEQAQRKRFNESILDRRGAEISAIKATTVVHSLYMYIWQFGTIIVLMAGGYMVIKAKLTLGELVAFIYYVVYLTFNMFDIGQFLVKSRQSAVSINRLLELENVAPMVEDGGTANGIENVRGHLIISNANFAFDGSERQILNNVTIEVNPGQRIAVVGRIGSGKSWLINLIPRLVDPSSGSVYLDGRDIREFKLEDLRKVIGYVPQEPILFSDTIVNNIRFGRGWVSDFDIKWAIDIAQFRSDIETFPHGIDTHIGTRGMTISGGQKQRLALARALAGKPKILILDDCMSALDSQTESALWKGLNEIIPDMAVVMITHRPDTLEGADHIYVMEDGAVVELGRHQELIVSGGQYARLYRRYQLEQQVS
jgi:ATP-binding cassette, subfamily B, multidrug efflux pump